MLEHALGVPLFVRSRSGLEPTEAARAFLPKAREIVALSEELLAEMRGASKGDGGSLVVGHNSPISSGHLHADLSQWMEENPHLIVEQVEAPHPRLFSDIERKHMDLAVMTGDAEWHGIRRTLLWSEPILAVMAADHPLASIPKLAWSDLVGQTFHLTAAEPGPDIRDLLLGRLSALGHTVAIHMTEATRESVLGMIASKRAITFISGASAGATYEGLVYKEVHDRDGPAGVSFSGYWKPDNPNPALKAFLRFIQRRHGLRFSLTQLTDTPPEAQHPGPRA
jgi:DNA-binding transcriptional LysR family regulator